MKKLTSAQAYPKIRHYCAYQERSHKEVRNKLFEYGLYASEVDELLTQLITDGFLNEERYAKAFAGGKFRIKKWGRIKIVNELESSGVSQYCITKALKEITEDDYLKTLHELLNKKADLLHAETPFEKRSKLARYAIQKGFEPDLVWPAIKNLTSGESI